MITVPTSCLLLAYFLFWPFIKKSYQKELEILGLVTILPGKFINEKLDSLEEEIETIMEQLDDQSEENNKVGASASNSLPSQGEMARHSPRRLIKVRIFLVE